MFTLFYNIILALFTGTWVNYSTNQIFADIGQSFGALSSWLGSLFACFSPHLEGLTDQYMIEEANQSIVAFPSIVADGIFGSQNFLKVIACVLALISVIGIVLVVIKAIKSIFTVFFYGLR